MTRRGELGCCNCDGPCLGCWEDPPVCNCPAGCLVHSLPVEPLDDAEEFERDQLANDEVYE
jgi:hypothetical protein